MELIFILLLAALVFGACYAVDKTFTKLFRSKAQHRSGMAVRAGKTYGVFGVILSVLGIMGICAGFPGGMLLVLGVLVLILGICLAVYYLSFGIFYDGDTFLVCRFGKKDREYAYRDILGQRLYLIQGGSLVIELHMADGSSVSMQSTMEGVTLFLDTAFAAWCMQTGKDPQDCAFHDPANSLWFPTMEEN